MSASNSETSSGEKARQAMPGRRHPKSRSGCVTCKKRRVKCDETAPSCHQCLRRNLVCPGYRKPLQWVRKHEKFRVDQPALKRTIRVDSNNDESAGSGFRDTPDVLRVDATDLDVETRMCRSLTHLPTRLVDHYFQTTCLLWSSFDSYLNPFRTAVASMMASSPGVFYSVQAMSAAHLSTTQRRSIPEAKIGELYKQATAAIAESLDGGGGEPGAVRDETLLCMTFMGMASAWHDVGDTGLPVLYKARTLLLAWLLGKALDDRQDMFIFGVHVYWEMIAALITDDPQGSFQYLDFLHANLRLSSFTRDRLITLNPLTGASPDVFILFGKVAALVRMQAWEHATGGYGSTSARWIELAESLETDLLAWDCPLSTCVEDTFDQVAPVSHLLKIAEAYRYSALLQLYSIFPHLLSKRLPEGAGGRADDLLLSWLDGECMDGGFDDTLQRRGREAEAEFLQGLAIHILRILRDIPETSRTIITQGVLLLSVAEHLTIPRRTTLEPSERAEPTVDSDSDAGTPAPAVSHDAHTLGLLEWEYWRAFVRRRLQTCRNYMGTKPSVRLCDMVEEVWKQLDGGREITWATLMVEKKWETVLG